MLARVEKLFDKPNFPDLLKWLDVHVFSLLGSFNALLTVLGHESLPLPNYELLPVVDLSLCPEISPKWLEFPKGMRKGSTTHDLIKKLMSLQTEICIHRQNKAFLKVPPLLEEVTKVRGQLCKLRSLADRRKYYRIRQKPRAPLTVSGGSPKKGRPQNIPSALLLESMNTIVASSSTAAHERRRDHSVSSTMQLVDLVEGVQTHFRVPVSYTTVRHYTLPKNKTTRQAHHHHPNATIKLCKSQYDKSASNSDQHGYHANIKQLRYIAQMFPGSVLYISRDKKATIPSVGPAVSKQVKRVHQSQSYVKVLKL